MTGLRSIAESLFWIRCDKKIKSLAYTEKLKCVLNFELRGPILTTSQISTKKLAYKLGSLINWAITWVDFNFHHRPDFNIY